MTTIVRFAPSPTGFIHIGNTRIALFNWLFALQNKGQFILRFDDTDTVRSKTEYAEATIADLEWLGIEPVRIEYQSKRIPLYDAAAEKLKTAGVLYPCYETAEELERKRKLRLARRLPPIYGREALKLTAADREKLEAEGRRPHWRFLLPNFKDDPFAIARTEVHWDDLVRGRETVDLSSLSDPVLVREDGTYLYTFTSVVDDIDMDITHIIRGNDHITNSGVQISIIEALGAKVPALGHINLLTTASGEGISKRTGALSIGSLRRDGYEPMAVASLAVLIGTSENVTAVPDMASLAAIFDPAATSKSASKFDPADLDALNRALIHAMPFEEVSERLTALGIKGDRAGAFWLAVRGNLSKVLDAAAWWTIVNEGPATDVAVAAEDADFVRAAFDLLPAEPWSRETWKQWTDAVKDQSGRKGKSLFMPLRIALTGLASGPELADLLPLLGREGTLARRP
ncbi:glutamate--tRNA ligase [Phyllobacterium sp. SYP-B3895]|uniref:glutamate--tRNA ligase n=1 Tax=Phyllobacterium sp. SYP-B3895 TaxID=2663240 RepID=UPI00129A07A9|nr:glutamate--tRNA ligase [Phyllobacterium sp. SYP-B3895]MRG57100.1 glutamate--tRNA ligase [Phyllobacterium sp. SYP-B3895]